MTFACWRTVGKLARIKDFVATKFACVASPNTPARHFSADHTMKEGGRVRHFLHNMDWSNEKVLEFIHCYETESILWNPNNPDHKKKHLVNEAWVRIKKKLSWRTTVDDMKKKKDSLMSYYRAHIHKIKKSGGAEFKTNWFAFAALNSFLQPVYVRRPSLEAQNESVQEESSDSDDEGSTGSKEVSTPQLNSRIPTKRARIDLPSEILHRRKQMQEASEYVERSVDDECEIFGKLMASKLRKIKNPNTRDIIMNDMQNMVFQACMRDRASEKTVQLAQAPKQEPPSQSPSYSSSSKSS